jgi:hypothetical protein
MIWDLTAPPVKAAAPARRPAEQCWEDLGRTDAAVAFRAMGELVAAPDEAVALFRARLSPVAPVPSGRVEALIADLGHAKYAVREKATRELAGLGGQARRPLLKALASRPEGEAATRLRHLVDLLDAPAQAPDWLRARRAVEVLERIGTPAALDRLNLWARGAPGASLTENARQATHRVRVRLGLKTP